MILCQGYLFWVEVARTLTGARHAATETDQEHNRCAADTKKDIVYWDSGCPGFGLKITPKGRKVFILLYDPAAEKQQARRRLVAGVEDLVELFITEHVSTKRSGREITRLLRREVMPKWETRSLHEIVPRRQHVEM